MSWGIRANYQLELVVSERKVINNLEDDCGLITPLADLGIWLREELSEAQRGEVK